VRSKPSGKDIALFGGGELFRSLVAAGLVDGLGVSLPLTLRKQRLYERTGTIIGLEYDIEPH